MMALQFYTFAHLKTAKQEIKEDLCNYKSGASFSGNLQNNKKSGVGVFLWPSGDKYDGEYVDNERDGKGRQDWSDGSFYEGDFVMDTRHGQGYHKWANGEIYEGSYFKDHRHGYGVYIWPGNMKFQGKFYMDKKEGYGVFFFPNGTIFKGLYKDDEREGPGILTYPDKQEDIGLWSREKLIKLTSCIDSAFTVKDHSKFQYFSDENIITVIQTDENCQEKNLEYNSYFDVQDMDNNQRTNLTVQQNRPRSVDMRTLHYDRQEYDVAFFGESYQGNDDHTISIADNNTPSLINMQKHILKHKRQEKTLIYPVSDIIQGKRGNSSCKGPIEMASESLIWCAASGNVGMVSSLLASNQVDVNVADKHGQHALLAAVVNVHGDVINCLLDNGADVNKLNDEGVSALAACHVLFYPIESFQYNIAERYLHKPKEEVEREMHLNLTTHSLTPTNCTRIEDLTFEKKEENMEAGKAEENFVEAGDEHDSLLPVDEELAGRHLQDYVDDLGVDVASKNNTELTLFDSNKSLVNYSIEVNDDLVECSATVMSGNSKIVAGRTSKCSVSEPDMDRARLLAISKAEHSIMESTIRLLLKRGADPNASTFPMPVLFFAIKAADVDAVKILLEKGASTETRLSAKKEGLRPLHIASGIRGKAGVEITRLLLEAGAEPNVCTIDYLMDQDEEFKHSKLKASLENNVLALSSELSSLEEEERGRTPLHIACHRDDDNKLAKQIVKLLLLHGANPNVLCRGQSPLSLAIANGNDLAIDELLAFSANPSLPLGQSIGSALCVASNTAYEFRRSPQERINLISRLVKSGANILAPVAVGPKKLIGTAVDYAYWAFNQDRRIAHMPYHALTHAERDTYNARRRLLSFLGDILREASVCKEKERLVINGREGLRSISPSSNFLYTGAGAQYNTGDTKLLRSPIKSNISEPVRQVVFRTVTKDNAGREHPLVDRDEEVIIRKPLFKYCYECGRALGVRLSACTRCKEVYYCSKACKLKAWNARHKEECLRIGDHSRSPSPTCKAAGLKARSTGSVSDKRKVPSVKHTSQADAVKCQVKNDRRLISGKLGNQGMTSENNVINDLTENYSFN